MGKVGIAVLSFAHGHVNAYCHQIRGYDDAKLVCCWDDDEGRGKNAANAFGIPFTSHLEDVLQNPEVEAVMIASETSKHTELAVAAAEAGKSILLQKPMALTLEDCDRIIEAVDRAKIKFMMAYQMRHDPMNKKIAELVHSGAIGNVGVIRRRHCIPVLFNEGFINGPSRWHIDPEKNMGMFMDDASHAADFLYWIMGCPTSVIAEIDNILTDVAPDDNGVAVYRYPNKAMSILFNSSTTWAGENTTEVYGDKGVIIQNYDDSPSTNVPRPPDAVGLKMYLQEKGDWEYFDIPLPDGHGERIAAVARPFVDYLLDDKAPTITAEDGRCCIEMILGAYRSAQQGKRVMFPL